MLKHRTVGWASFYRWCSISSLIAEELCLARNTGNYISTRIALWATDLASSSFLAFHHLCSRGWKVSQKMSQFWIFLLFHFVWYWMEPIFNYRGLLKWLIQLEWGAERAICSLGILENGVSFSSKIYYSIVVFWHNLNLSFWSLHV